MALLQGVFLGFVLYQRRGEFRKPMFWLFTACVLSVVLFSLGDDDYNLFFETTDWLLFRETLIISFFFLFVRYSSAEREVFNKRDLLFLLPYTLNVCIESLMHWEPLRGNAYLEMASEVVELSFVVMLFYSIYDIWKHKKEKWLQAFAIPFTIIYLIDEITGFFSGSDVVFMSLDSYGFFLLSIMLFYFVIYKLMVDPKQILLKRPEDKYKDSGLSKSAIERIQTELKRLMLEERMFTNQKLSAQALADSIGVPRQHLSEVLNVHMGVRLQDFLNEYRVEEFVRCLKEERYQNLTLLGIANEVGFSSKSSFNATFKKLKGMTPSEYKKGLV